MAAVSLEGVINLVLRDVGRGGNLLHRRAPLVFLLKLVKGLVNLVYGANLVEWQSDYTALFGYSLQDALPDPPHGIGDKLETACLVEFLRSSYQSNVALVDEVCQAESLILILLCN